MRIALAVLLTIHALLHLMGFLKAFGMAELPQLAVPISKPLGGAWLVAMLALLLSAVTLFVAPRLFWLVGAVGIITSEAVILLSWSDAKWGTVVNLALLPVVLHGAFSRGPLGLRAAYEEEVHNGLSQPQVISVITEADLTPLPVPVQRYLRFAGVLGQPRVHNFRVRFVGRIRSTADAPWMEFTAEQFSFVDGPTRLFMMDARMKGLPVDVFHSYVRGEARMQVKVLSLYPMIDASGPEFSKAETVTVFNDMCIMAPGTLVSPAITWKLVDERAVEGTFMSAEHTIRAVLHFDDSGALVNFTSDDRPGLAPDGKTFVPQRWSTPLRDYRAHGALRLASHGDARYAPASGEFSYGQFDLQEIAYNVSSPGWE